MTFMANSKARTKTSSLDRKGGIDQERERKKEIQKVEKFRDKLFSLGGFLIALNFFLIKIVPRNIMPDERNYAFLRCIYNLAIVIRSKNKRIGFQNSTPKPEHFSLRRCQKHFYDKQKVNPKGIVGWSQKPTLTVESVAGRSANQTPRISNTCL